MGATLSRLWFNTWLAAQYRRRPTNMHRRLSYRGGHYHTIGHRPSDLDLRNTHSVQRAHGHSWP